MVENLIPDMEISLFAGIAWAGTDNIYGALSPIITRLFVDDFEFSSGNTYVYGPEFPRAKLFRST